MSRMVVVNNIIVMVWRYCFLLRTARFLVHIQFTASRSENDVLCCHVMVVGAVAVCGKSKWVSRVVMM